MLQGKTENQEEKSFKPEVYIAGFCAFLLIKYFGVIGGLLLIGAALGGMKFSDWYMSRDKVNSSLIRWVGWSNVLTWLLPVVGIFTGVSSMRFSAYIDGERVKYRILGLIGVLLAVVNMVLWFFFR